MIIHKKSPNGGNHTVIKAKSGELAGSTNSDVLSLILNEGNYYDEIMQSDYSKRARKPFMKSYFDEYVINIDLSNFNNVDLEDESYSNTDGMLKASELRESIDSFSVAYNTRMDQFRENMYSRSGLRTITRNFKPKDTTVAIGNSVLDQFNAYDGAQIANLALGTINSAKAHLSMKKTGIQEFHQTAE